VDQTKLWISRHQERLASRNDVNTSADVAISSRLTVSVGGENPSYTLWLLVQLKLPVYTVTCTSDDTISV